MRLRTTHWALGLFFLIAWPGCGGDDDSSSADYVVGGTVSGLAPGKDLVLANDDAEELTVTENGPFAFSKRLQEGQGYQVTLRRQPEGQVCTVENGTGTVGQQDVTDILVTCVDEQAAYSVGGTLSGLDAGGQLVLQNNGGDDLTLTDNGTFVFSTKVADGSGYEVTVSSQPEGQVCEVQNGSGTVAGADVTDVVVTCRSDNGNFEPYFFDDFESYDDGESLSGFNPFDAAGRTKASTEQAHSGEKSARMEILEGDNGGFGKWGGIIPINPALPKGAEVWVSLWVYWPSSFQFTASPWMKFLRLHNRTGSGDNGGYNDLYVDNADGTTSVLRTIKEFHDVWAVYDGPPLPRDQWERYEMYLFIDDVPVDEGGQGRVRIWRNDELIFDRTDVPTITEAQGTINSFYLFTYWNNENPPNNHCYVDDLVIATSDSPPPNHDAQGNLFIGNWPQ